MPEFSKKNGLFVLFLISSLIIFYEPLKDLLAFSLSTPHYSHFILIPLVSLYCINSERKKIFTDIGYSFPGIALITLSLILLQVGAEHKNLFDQNDYLSLMGLSIVIFWIGGFILVYGLSAFRNAYFSLFFLVFIIPIPQLILDKIILSLQIASAEVSYLYFTWTGIPVYREGFIFELPGIVIEVAKQCGGIRSSIVLFILSVLLGQFFLKKWWQKILLVLSIFPITVMKNGVRIVTLSFLAVYWDKSVLTDSIIHGRSGYPFFILAMAEMGVVLWILKKTDRL